MIEVTGEKRPADQEPADQEPADEEPADEEPADEPRDWRAALIGLGGLLALVVVAIAAYIALPNNPLAKGQVDVTAANVAAVTSAVTAAIASVVASYFGIKAANVAREDSVKSSERNAVRLGEVAGAAPPEAAEAALRRAAASIRSR